MTINEKTIVRRSAKFTQEDLDLFRSAAAKVYSDMDIKHLICYNDRGLAAVLVAIKKVSDSVMYNADLTVEDYDSIETMSDTLCAFSANYPDDQIIEQVEALWDSLLAIKTMLRKEM